jgi:hypothetical protein
MTEQTSSQVLATLDQAIAAIEQQIADLERSTPEALRAQRRGAPASSVALKADDLELFLARLQQIKDLLLADPRLAPIVDDHLGERLRTIAAEQEATRHAAEKRQQRGSLSLAVITTVAGALLGWLLSALASPSAVLAWLGMR